MTAWTKPVKCLPAAARTPVASKTKLVKSSVRWIWPITASMSGSSHGDTGSPFCWRWRIAAFNQLSGINAVLYYTPSIFRMAGAGMQSALLQSVVVGCTMLVFTVLAMFIIDRVGRRKLMIVGSIGYIAGLVGAAYAFYFKVEGPLLLVSLLVFIAAHGFGQGAVIWVFISEIFPNRVRARGQSLGSFTHWAMNAGISWTFPVIAAAAGWMAFAFYAMCMVGQLAWSVMVMPETKGISLEKIQEELGIE